MPISKYQFHKTLLAFKMPKSGLIDLENQVTGCSLMLILSRSLKTLSVTIITNIVILNARKKAFKMSKKKHFKHPYFGILNAKNVLNFY